MERMKGILERAVEQNGCISHEQDSRCAIFVFLYEQSALSSRDWEEAGAECSQFAEKGSLGANEQ